MTPRPVEVTTPTDREIVLVRYFAAPPDLVFAALTTPDLLRRWYGARGWNLVACEIDLRVGGAWQYVSEGPTGERMVQSGVYRVVDAPRLLVSTERFDNQSYEGESVVRHHLVERDGGTKLTTTVRYASQAARDTALRYPMARGVSESYERLDAVLAESFASPKERIKKGNPMDWTLEVVVVPVSDVDRAKVFYAERLGFNVDHDTAMGEGMRVVQLTPPGSGCSIVIGEGVVPPMEPGSLKGLQLVVADLPKARAQLVERGVDVSEIQVMGESPAPTADPLDNVGFVFFSDPDGNSWGVQQISSRATA